MHNQNQADKRNRRYVSYACRLNRKISDMVASAAPISTLGDCDLLRCIAEEGRKLIENIAAECRDGEACPISVECLNTISKNAQRFGRSCRSRGYYNAANSAELVRKSASHMKRSIAATTTSGGVFGNLFSI